MPDPASQLARLYQAGFEIETYERFPRAVGVVRGECVALMEPQPDGLRMLGRPGWKMGEALGVLIERGGRRYFQSKTELLEATEERLAALREFEEELGRLLLSAA